MPSAVNKSMKTTARVTITGRMSITRDALAGVAAAVVNITGRMSVARDILEEVAAAAVTMVASERVFSAGKSSVIVNAASSSLNSGESLVVITAMVVVLAVAMVMFCIAMAALLSVTIGD